MGLEFQYDTDRESRGREFQHKPDWFGGDPSLASYFRPDPHRPWDPQVLEESGWPNSRHAEIPRPDRDEWPRMCLFGDGSYYPDQRWYVGSSRLSYEIQCQTVDVLSYLLDWGEMGLERTLSPAHYSLAVSARHDPEAIAVLRDLCEELWGPESGPIRWMEAGRLVVQHRSWRSAYHEHHAQSIEGDYELFDAFEADWLAQQELPRRWTRMGLNILNWCVDDFFTGNYGGVASNEELIETRQRRLERNVHERVPEVPLVTHEDWDRARAFLTALGIRGNDRFGPTLADFFC